MVLVKLPPYPPVQARKQLPASQSASLNSAVSSTLNHAITLPLAKLDTESARIFVQSYARDVGFQVLQNLIWSSPEQKLSTDEKLIEKYTLVLAEKVAGYLDLQTLLDLSIGYSRSTGNKKRLQAVFTSASDAGGRRIQDAIEKDLVPALTLLLSPQSSSNQSQGLYSLRKIAHCILSFLRASPPCFIRPFSHSKPFLLALAQVYDLSLASVAASYGGLNILRSSIDSPTSEVDDWERIWVETKLALIDAFHLILNRMLEDMSAAKGRNLALEAERTFDIIFSLLDLPGSSRSSHNTSTPPTPFLNQPLLADYQQSYSLSKTLTSILKNAKEKDARLDVLESALQSFDLGANNKRPGALKIILHSQGMQPGTKSNSRSTQSYVHKALNTLSQSSSASASLVDLTSIKGKSREVPRIAEPDIDIKVAQVLDVLPDNDPNYIRLLLGSEKYNKDVEQVLAALLEGRAPTEEDLLKEIEFQPSDSELDSTKERRTDKAYDVTTRRNVFDEEEMDMSKVRIGKATIENDVLKDRSYVDQMKADILRRAEAILEDEEEIDDGVGKRPKGQNNDSVALNPEDELEVTVRVKPIGDGEETSESDTEDDAADEQITPETIVELAWLKNPELFNRDAATRRSKEREQLRKDTGWAHEQIEGWKVMLDRDPKLQAKIREKHEFNGRQEQIPVHIHHAEGSRGRGRGRGRGGGGGGRGRGGGGNAAREHALKDKHKANRANHNRKRGHDKKMAKAGAGIPSAT